MAENTVTTEKSVENRRRMLVARAIVDDLGDAKFKLITGVTKFYASAHGVRFNLPSGSSKTSVEQVAIAREANGDNLVVFRNALGHRVGELKVVTSDKLRETFEEATGIRLSIRRPLQRKSVF